MFPGLAQPVYIPQLANTMHVATLASVTGHISNTPVSWPVTHVWLAWYWPLSEDGLSGVWVLEPSLCPSAVTQDDGSFAVLDVPPGRYCIVYGFTPVGARVVGGRHATVYDVRAHGALDVGTLGPVALAPAAEVG